MKKIFISMLIAAATLTASAAGKYNSVWVDNVSSLEGTAPSFSGKVAVDAAGNTFAANVFDKAISLGGKTLEPVGTSSYITKYGIDGKAEWAVAISGAATVTAMKADAAGNLVVAGTFADEVEFGTTSGEALTKGGVKIDDAYVSTQDAGFVAFYGADGKLNSLTSFVPERPANMADLLIFPAGGDFTFYINNISLDENGNAICSAVYSGATKVGDTTFEGSYDDVFMGGFYYDILKASSVFKLTPAGECTELVKLGYAAPQASMEDQYKLLAGTGTYKDGMVYAAFTGYGPLQLSTKTAAESFTTTFQNYSFYLAKVNAATGEIVKTAVVPAANADAYSPFAVKNVFVEGDNFYGLGYETAEAGKQMFVITAPAADIATADKKTFTTANGNVAFYGVNAAAYDEGILFSAAGYYTETEAEPNPKPEGWKPAYRNGDFANTSKGFFFNGDFTAVSTIDDASAIAAAPGKFQAVAIAATAGSQYKLYGNDAAGVSSIEYSANTPVEYFNLQGMRVKNPSAGIYIIRQGNKVSKAYIK